MMSDLLTQLADYGEYCEERQGSVAVDEIKRIVTPDQSGSQAASVDTAIQAVEAEPAERPVDDLMVDYLQQRPDEGDAPSEQKRWSGVVVAVAATILVVVGVVVVADGNSGDVVTNPASSPAATDPVPSPSAADPVVAPSVLDPVSGYRWSQIPHDEAVFGRVGEMHSVIVAGPGLVAVARD